jgi:hypothetical protein
MQDKKNKSGWVSIRKEIELRLLTNNLLTKIYRIMNKKVLTLSAALLLAGSLTAVAQVSVDGVATYRSEIVKSAALDAASLNAVQSINQEYYYQLQVKPASIGKVYGEYVLVTKRDYATGKVYLAVSPIAEAGLTRSLWKIKVTSRAVNSFTFSFINKETGYELAYDDARAEKSVEGLASLSEQHVQALGEATGCISNWAWYTTDTDTKALDYKRIYSYFHAKADSVIGLAAVQKLGTTVYPVVPVKLSKKEAGDFLLNTSTLADEKFIAIKPVVAGAQVLSAADINSMIDANGSYLNFADHKYAESDATKYGKSSKFTVCKPGTYEELSFAKGANPFADNSFVAEEHALTGVVDDYAGYNILMSVPGATKEDATKYLYVSEFKHEGDAFQSIYNALQVTTEKYRDLNDNKVNEYAKAADAVTVPEEEGEATPHNIDALSARYHWKVTYYPTQDSVVFEPLNASCMPAVTAQKKLKPGESTLELVNDSKLTTASNWLNTINSGDDSNAITGGTNYNAGSAKAEKVPVALYALNFGPSAGDKAAYLSVGYAEGGDGTIVNPADGEYAATEKANHAYVTSYQSKMKLAIRFNHSYENDYELATVDPGLYFINLKSTTANKTQTENRVPGAYLVKDMENHFVYDTQDDAQNFLHMPATQWVVEPMYCAEGDELNYNKTPQVVIYNREFNDNEDSVKNAFFFGQLYKNKKTGNIVSLNHQFGAAKGDQNVDHHSKNKFLPCEDEYEFTNITEKQTQFGYFNETDNSLRESTYTFQHLQDMKADLYLSESNGYVKLADAEDATEFELYRSLTWIPTENDNKTYDFTYSDSIPYGYNNDLVKPLSLGVYKLKVKDENLIDNDHKFLAITNQHKYVIATEDQINSDDKLTFAIVALKENNDLEGVHAYAIQNLPFSIEAQDAVAKATADDLKGLTLKDGEFSKGGVVYFKASAEGQVFGKMEIENVSLYAKIADLCETTTDAFIMNQADRKLYYKIDDEYVNNDKKVLALKDAEGEYLYEDSSSKLAKENNLNYLAVENKTTTTKNEGFYVDYVAKSTTAMPQYLLAVAADSVPAYTYCTEGLHGINPSCGHIAEVPGYVEGRYLVNFNDSVKKAYTIDKLSKNASPFLSSNYVRLGFVEALHQGDTLYVMKDGNQLADWKEGALDNSGNYVVPEFFKAENAGKIYDKVALDGKHNNVAFSFRNTGYEDGGFLIESNDVKGYSQIGSFAGAWIKIHNNVPVLAQFSNDNGNHNTGDSTDSWKQYTDYTTANTLGEVINQAAIFNAEFMTKDASATANEAISASDVTVAATTGAVVVKGAAGKSVVITNILGQTLATAVISSDNATINVPAGIAVVAVEGEEAVKVVVK